MSPSILVDTGPLFALFSERDKYHKWALKVFNELKPPLITCDAVVAETLYMLRSDPRVVSSILGLIEQKIVIPDFSVGENAASIRKLMGKYKDMPMDFADACLVRMTELIDDCLVWTLDSDFKVYRRNGRAVIPLIYQ